MVGLLAPFNLFITIPQRMASSLDQTPRKQKTQPTVLHQLRQDTQVLALLPVILDKMEEEGFLRVLHDSLSVIMSNEILSAQAELRRLDGHAESPGLLTSNLFVFKENLKAISNLISGLTSRRLFQEPGPHGTAQRAAGGRARGDRGDKGGGRAGLVGGRALMFGGQATQWSNQSS